MTTEEGAMTDQLDEVSMRRYLEQMMMAFTWSQVPVDEAADLLAEIESHCLESGAAGTPVDPFEEFGDPIELATSMIPVDHRRETTKSIVLGLLFGVTGVAGLLLIAALAGVEQVSAVFVGALVMAGGTYTVLSFLLAGSLRSVDPETSPAPRKRYAAGAAAGVATAIAVYLVVRLAGDDNRLALDATVLALATAVGLPISATILWRMYRLRGRIEAPVHDGVTGEIIADMRTAGFVDGWVRYGPDGTDLRDPAWSWRAELGRSWSTLRSAMTERD